MGSAELHAAWRDAGVTDPGTRTILEAVPLDGGVP